MSRCPMILYGLVATLPLACVSTYELGATRDAQVSDAADGLAPDAVDSRADAADASPDGCLSDFEPCTGGTDCCSGLCLALSSETLACRPPTVCLAHGEGCSFSMQCCGYRCAEGICHDDFAACAGANETCADPNDCCSGVCLGDPAKCQTVTSCRLAGDLCNNGGECCSGLCLLPDWSETKRCVLLPLCRVAGERCVSPADCCSGACELGVDNLLRCIPPLNNPSHCVPMGGLCDKHDECCSGLCDNLDGTRGRCQPLGGCRPTGERCEYNLDCCAGDCALEGDGVMRCRPDPGGCLALGEPCSQTADCCDAAPDACRPSTAGVDRCLGDPQAPCVPPGYFCLATDQCCQGACLLDGTSVYRVCLTSPACLPAGALCTGAGDCCPGSVCGLVQDSLRCVAL